MRKVEAFARHWSRRCFLVSFPLLRLPVAAQEGSVLASVAKHYTDPSTEFEVVRWTDPAYACYFPNYYCRFVARKHKFLIYGSTRTGTMQACQLDLGNGRRRSLTGERQLDGSSLTLFPDDRHFAYFAGDTLWKENLSHLRRRPLYRVAGGWGRGEGFALSRDGRYATVPETNGRRFRIRLIDLHRRRISTAVESKTPLRHPVPRSRSASILYRDENDSLWVAGFRGRNRRRLRTAPGKTGPAIWSPAGDSVLYLNFPAERSRRNNLREYFVDTRQDRLVALTSQFVCFGVNANASVFVGASGSKAMPYVALLLRTGGRELTLCEHDASNPSAVEPVFSPDSRFIFFLSDRDGHSAIYSIRVDNLVEATPS